MPTVNKEDRSRRFIEEEPHQMMEFKFGDTAGSEDQEQFTEQPHVFYHETHKYKIDSIKKNGLTSKDYHSPKWYTLTDNVKGARNYSSGSNDRHIAEFHLTHDQVKEHLYHKAAAKSDHYGTQYALKKPLHPSMLKAVHKPDEHGNLTREEHTSQHSEEGEEEPLAIAFEENEAVTKLRDFILKGTNKHLKETLAKILTIKKVQGSLSDLAKQVEKELRLLQPKLTTDLVKGMYGSSLEGIAEVASKLNTLPQALQPDTDIPDPEQQFGHTTLIKTGLATSLQQISDEPLTRASVNLPVLNEVVQRVSKLPVTAGINYKDTAAKVHAGAFAVTGELTDHAVTQVKDLLVEALEKGTNKNEFIDNVVEKLGSDKLSEPHIENIFRTNTAAALSAGQQQAVNSPMVVDAFPYAAYHATLDSRVREEHLALEKAGLNGTNIYRADDPTFLKFRPPWSYQCRCSWTPTTVLQASRKGVEEAKEWINRAEQFANTKGGNYNQYLSQAKPATPQFVEPPPFEPSPEFKRV